MTKKMTKTAANGVTCSQAGTPRANNAATSRRTGCAAVGSRRRRKTFASSPRVALVLPMAVLTDIPKRTLLRSC